MNTVRVRVVGVYKSRRGFAGVLGGEGEEKVLPIFVSKGQAFSIKAGITKMSLGSPRASAVGEVKYDMDLEVEAVTIDDLMEGTFLAELRLVRGVGFFLMM